MVQNRLYTHEGDSVVTKCAFAFRRDEWTEPVPGRTDRLPKEWTCPHDAADSADYCPFHAADASPSAVRDAFHTALADGSPETNAFVGATLPDLGLQNETITADTPLDLRAVTFTETLDLEDARILTPIRFEGSHFQGRLELDDTRFEREVTFYRSRFDGVVEGNGTTFTENAYFIGTEFSYSLLLTANTTFEADAFFTEATFHSAADLSNTTFHGQAFFRAVEFHGRTAFDRATFHDDARFAAAAFTGSLSFEHTHIDGVLQFGGTGINHHYDAATFTCPLLLEHAHCEGGAYFVNCTFNSDIQLIKSNFKDIVDLSDITLTEPVDLTRSTIADLTLTPHSVDGQVLVDATETTIHTGVIRPPTDGDLFCHFEDGTTGPVDFLTADSTRETPRQLDLRWVRFIDTTFDGFDFTRYRDCLNPDWQLHEFTHPASSDPLDLAPIKRELTYVRAKSGANDIGDNRAASQFFKREMRARGARHKQDLRTNTSIRAGYRYLGNRAFWLTANYAESPQRVLGSSLLLIAAFAVLYAIGFQTSSSPTPYTDSPLLGSLLLSGESFVTLVHTPGATIPTAPLRALTILEGFLGAFAIALFLFTLTRAVHR